jgi:hypothetical protein
MLNYHVAMRKQHAVATYRLFFGLLAFTAMGVQLEHTLTGGHSAVNFFSFFTIESNVFAALIFLISGIGLLRSTKNDVRFSLLRGAAALYMTTTGIIYVLLLSGLEASLQTTIPWVNTVVHYIMPLVVFLDWFVTLPQKRVHFRPALRWLVFPVAYVVYGLIRGRFVNWYPYPFLDPRLHGYLPVAGISLVIAVAVVGLTAVLSFATYIRRE